MGRSVGGNNIPKRIDSLKLGKDFERWNQLRTLLLGSSSSPTNQHGADKYGAPGHVTACRGTTCGCALLHRRSVRSSPASTTKKGNRGLRRELPFSVVSPAVAPVCRCHSPEGTR